VDGALLLQPGRFVARSLRLQFDALLQTALSAALAADVDVGVGDSAAGGGGTGSSSSSSSNGGARAPQAQAQQQQVLVGAVAGVGGGGRNSGGGGGGGKAGMWRTQRSLAAALAAGGSSDGGSSNGPAVVLGHDNLTGPLGLAAGGTCSIWMAPGGADISSSTSGAASDMLPLLSRALDAQFARVMREVLAGSVASVARLPDSSRSGGNAGRSGARDGAA
jgi:hypothetical protein